MFSIKRKGWEGVVLGDIDGLAAGIVYGLLYKFIAMNCLSDK